MTIIEAKQKINAEIDRIDDLRIINGIKKFIDQYDPDEVLEEGDLGDPKEAKWFYKNLPEEKENIKREIEATKYIRLLKCMTWFIDQYDPNDAAQENPKQPPIADWEMVNPYGRKPTRKQFAEWMDKDDDENDEGMPAEEAFAIMRKELSEDRKKWNIS